MARTDNDGNIVESDEAKQRRAAKTARVMAKNTEIELQQKAAINGAKYDFKSVPEKKKSAYQQMSEEQLRQAIEELNGKIAAAGSSNGLKKRSRYEIAYINTLLEQEAQQETTRAKTEFRAQDVPMRPAEEESPKIAPDLTKENLLKSRVSNGKILEYGKMDANELAQAYEKIYSEWARFTQIYEAEGAKSTASTSTYRSNYQKQLEAEAEYVGYLLQQKLAGSAQEVNSPVVDAIYDDGFHSEPEDENKVFRDMQEHVKGGNETHETKVLSPREIPPELKKILNDILPGAFDNKTAAKTGEYKNAKEFVENDPVAKGIRRDITAINNRLAQLERETVLLNREIKLSEKKAQRQVAGLETALAAAKQEAKSEEEKKLEAQLAGLTQKQKNLEKEIAGIENALKGELTSRVRKNLEARLEKYRKVLEETSAQVKNMAEQLQAAAKGNEKVAQLEGQLAAAKKQAEAAASEQKKKLAALLETQKELQAEHDEKTKYLRELVKKKFAEPEKDGKKVPVTQDAAKKEGQEKQDDEKKQEEGKKNEDGEKKQIDREKVMSDYVELLRAKEKWRNTSVLFRPDSNMGKFKKAMRWLAFLPKPGVAQTDAQTIANTQQIQQDFRELVQQDLNAAPDQNAKQMALKKIYDDIADRLNTKKSKIDSFFRWMRKPMVAFGRFLLGAGLIALGALTGGAGWLATAAGIGTFGLGAVGRFIGVDGLWDNIRGNYTGRTKNQNHEYAAAANVFYNNAKSKRLDVHVGAISATADAAKVSTDVDTGFISFAEKSAKNRFWKRMTALAGVVLPVAALKYFGGDAAAAQPEPTKPSIVPPQQPVSPVPGDMYNVPDGGGYWHIAKDIVDKNMPGASAEEKARMLPKAWQYIMQNHEQLGITPDEMHPHTGAGAPWLNKGADMKFTPDDWKSFMQGIMNGKKMPNTSTIVMNGAKAAVRTAAKV